MPGRRFADCNDDLSRTTAIISTAGARRQVLFAASYPAPGVPGQRRSSVRRPASRAPRSARRRVCACYLMRMSDANQHSITLFDGLGRVQSELEAGGWPPVPAAAVLHQPMLTRCLRNEIGIPPCTDIDPVAGEFRGTRCTTTRSGPQPISVPLAACQGQRPHRRRRTRQAMKAGTLWPI